MLRKLISLSLVAVMLSVTAFAATDIVGLNAAYAAEETAGALTVSNGKLFINGYGVQGSLSLTSAKDTTAKVITAIFDESDELISATLSEDIALTAGATASYPVTLDIPEEEAQENSYAFYLWEKGTLAPLANNVTAKATYGWSGEAAAVAPAIATAEDLDGTYAGYYMIKSPEDLAWFANNLAAENSANAVLCNDIYLNYFEDETGAFDEDWYNTSANVSAAKSWTNFMMTGSGILDGDGYAIYGVSTTGSYNGLYKKMMGTVKNINVLAGYLRSTISSTTNSTNYHGMLAATVTRPSSIENVTASGLIKPQSGGFMHNAGGLVGKVLKVDISGSDADNANSVQIKNCTSKVTITTEGGGTAILKANGANVTNIAYGGIVGNVERRCYITNCTNEGDIYAPNIEYVGGILGVTKYNTSRIIGTNKNTGHITGYNAAKTGQIVGELSGGVLTTTSGTNRKYADDFNYNGALCLGEIDVAYVAAPTADVASGEVAAGSAVKLTAARGTVYYAIGDGEYQKYTGDITINEATTIKAYAEYVGSTNTVKSTEATFTYTIAEATE